MILILFYVGYPAIQKLVQQIDDLYPKASLFPNLAQKSKSDASLNTTKKSKTISSLPKKSFESTAVQVIKESKNSVYKSSEVGASHRQCGTSFFSKAEVENSKYVIDSSSKLASREDLRKPSTFLPTTSRINANTSTTYRVMRNLSRQLTIFLYTSPIALAIACVVLGTIILMQEINGGRYPDAIDEQRNSYNLVGDATLWGFILCLSFIIWKAKSPYPKWCCI